MNCKRKKLQITTTAMNRLFSHVLVRMRSECAHRDHVIVGDVLVAVDGDSLQMQIDWHKLERSISFHDARLESAASVVSQCFECFVVSFNEVHMPPHRNRLKGLQFAFGSCLHREDNLEKTFLFVHPEISGGQKKTKDYRRGIGLG